MKIRKVSEAINIETGSEYSVYKVYVVYKYGDTDLSTIYMTESNAEASRQLIEEKYKDNYKVITLGEAIEQIKDSYEEYKDREKSYKKSLYD